MPHILVRGLDTKIVERLKQRARASGRSVQQEVKAIIERAATALTMDEARELSTAWRRRLGPKGASDSTTLIRDDRESR